MAESKVASNQAIEMAELKKKIDHVILGNDKEILRNINNLNEELHQEPSWMVNIRSLVRPILTLVLTLTFVLLILNQVGVFGELPTGEAREIYKDMFTVFLAIYGPIISFWFGERSAERTTK